MSFTYNNDNPQSATQIWSNPTTGGPSGASAPITVTAEGVISVNGANAFQMTGAGYTLTNSGIIRATTNAGAAGIAFLPDATAGLQKVTNTADGSITGMLNGIFSQYALNLVNSGLIQGKTGVNILSDDKSFTITNNASGEILSTNGGRAVNVSSTGGTHKISNAGLMDAVVVIGGANTISNTGTMGDVTLNTATGKSTITNSFQMGNIATGDTDDTVTNTNLMTGYVAVGNGNDKISNSGTIGGDAHMGEGNNSFTNSAATSYVLSVDYGNGNDTFSNKGTVDGSVSMGGGINTFTNYLMIAAPVVFGNDKDTVTNKGTIDGFMHLLSGDNTLTNSGTINGEVTGDDGIDKFTNSGTINGDVTTNANNDVLKNTGTITGIIDLGGGNDSFTNSGTLSGIFANQPIYMGGGDDKFTGGNTREFVIDETGKDTYILGGGDDVFFAAGGTGGDPAIDTVDGGSNTSDFHSIGIGDVYSITGRNFIPLANGAVVNLDSKTQSDVASVLPFTPIAAHTATGTDTGTDIVKNFESVYGGSGADVVFGSSVTNFIYGNIGSDHLYGGAGADEIYGGADADFLFGDAGKDYLQGDAGADMFSFRAASDSPSGKDGHDVIADFTDGSDLLNFVFFEGFDNTAAMTFRALDQAFDGAKNEFRFVTTTLGYEVQLDINGDKKADMLIDVLNSAHTITWSQADFDFLV
ncbi:MAG: hypothetical protein U1E15_08830 [Hyphomicrobiales bacterium]